VLPIAAMTSGLISMNSPTGSKNDRGTDNRSRFGKEDQSVLGLKVMDGGSLASGI